MRRLHELYPYKEHNAAYFSFYVSDDESDNVFRAVYVDNIRHTLAGILHIWNA